MYIHKTYALVKQSCMYVKETCICKRYMCVCVCERVYVKVCFTRIYILRNIYIY